MPTLDLPIAPLSDLAIIVNPQDNVAVAKQPIADGQQVQLPDGRVLRVFGAVTPGHRFATAAIPAGELVRQYAQPIGTSRGIELGDAVTSANMSSEVPVVRDVDENQSVAAPEYFAAEELATFLGYPRADGRVGTRNFILIAPTSMCASHEALQISMLAEFQHFSSAKYPHVDGVTAIPHNKGCGCQSGENLTVLMRTLANYAAHPNVGGVVMLDLGCEKTNLHIMEKFLIERTNALQKPLVRIGIQESGGTADTITRGLKAVEEMLPIVNQCERQPFPISELVLGVKCGSSDGLSGLSANPSLGYAADLLVRSHGTVLMTEVPEFCGQNTCSPIAPKMRPPPTPSTKWSTGIRTTRPQPAQSSMKTPAPATSPEASSTSPSRASAPSPRVAPPESKASPTMPSRPKDAACS